MTLTEYQNQKQITRRWYHSVNLNDQEYQAYYLTKDLLGIHIFAYPEFSYYIDNSQGYVVARNQDTGKYKSTVFRVDSEDIKYQFPDFKPLN